MLTFLRCLDVKMCHPHPLRRLIAPAAGSADGRKSSVGSHLRDFLSRRGQTLLSSAHPILSDEEVQSIKAQPFPTLIRHFQFHTSPGHQKLWLLQDSSLYLSPGYSLSSSTLNFVSASDFQKIQRLTSYKYDLTFKNDIEIGLPKISFSLIPGIVALFIHI